jgi:Domain of unknown function (DUF4145)
MKCPHCLENFHDSWNALSLGSDIESSWAVSVTHCPSCYRMIAYLAYSHARANFGITIPSDNATPTYLIRPKGIARAPLPPEVPPMFAGDYREGCLVLKDSPKASAALSRRCLQNLLREHGGVKRADLFDEIQQVIDSSKLPADLASALDAVRVIGNFSAHPIKSTNTGAIVDVEPQEAEWVLDTLESLFEFYFVRPAVLQAKRAALNAKLVEAGKPPLR